MSKKPVVDWGFACGRTYLTVNGYVVAMEGDVLRDMELGQKCIELSTARWGEYCKGKPGLLEQFVSSKVWTGDLIKFVAAVANGGILP